MEISVLREALKQARIAAGLSVRGLALEFTKTEGYERVSQSAMKSRIGWLETKSVNPRMSFIRDYASAVKADLIELLYSSERPEHDLSLPGREFRDHMRKTLPLENEAPKISLEYVIRRRLSWKKPDPFEKGLTKIDKESMDGDITFNALEALCRSTGLRMWEFLYLEKELEKYRVYKREKEAEPKSFKGTRDKLPEFLKSPSQSELTEKLKSLGSFKTVQSKTQPPPQQPQQSNQDKAKLPLPLQIMGQFRADKPVRFSGWTKSGGELVFKEYLYLNRKLEEVRHIPGMEVY